MPNFWGIGVILKKKWLYGQLLTLSPFKFIASCTYNIPEGFPSLRNAQSGMLNPSSMDAQHCNLIGRRQQKLLIFSILCKGGSFSQNAVKGVRLGAF
jgi:hypothetical protein